MTMELLGAALLIFMLRIVDVSLGTLRIAMLVRGHRLLAGGLGFFESIIWLVAASQVLNNLDSWLKIVAYAGGYAAGTMLGTTIEKWMAIGSILLRVIEPSGTASSVPALREAGFYATVMDAHGRDGTVQIIFSVIPRRRQGQALKIVQETNPKAYVTFEQTSRAASTAVVAPQATPGLFRWRNK